MTEPNLCRTGPAAVLIRFVYGMCHTLTANTREVSFTKVQCQKVDDLANPYSTASKRVLITLCVGSDFWRLIPRTWAVIGR